MSHPPVESSAQIEPTESTRLQIVDSIRACEIDGEIVLLNPASGLYYGLDAVGARVWALINERATLGQIRDALLVHYEVVPDVLWQDIIRLVREMRSHGLVVADESP